MQPTSELCVAEKRTVCLVCYHAEWLKRNKMLIPIKNSNYCIYVYIKCYFKMGRWSYTGGRCLNICFISSSKFCSSMRSASSIIRHYKKEDEVCSTDKLRWRGSWKKYNNFDEQKITIKNRLQFLTNKLYHLSYRFSYTIVT
jgi:hypothetical protein